MKVTYLPVLAVLRELYLQPRTMRRFRAYVETLTGAGSGDVVLPIGVANPMAKEHALTRIDQLLAQGSETIGAAAARFAEARLAPVPVSIEIKASIVLADDVGGGWTNRYTTEAMVRFPSRGALKRPFATALVWTSEATPATDQLNAEVLAAIYRVAFQQRFGLPVSLKQRLEQEGLAASFAGQVPALTAAQLEGVREIIGQLGDEPAYPTLFAALYGDEAAEQLGYQRLGLPPRAGFELALSDTLARGDDPTSALLTRA